MTRLGPRPCEGIYNFPRRAGQEGAHWRRREASSINELRMMRVCNTNLVNPTVRRKLFMLIIVKPGKATCHHVRRDLFCAAGAAFLDSELHAGHMLFQETATEVLR